MTYTQFPSAPNMTFDDYEWTTQWIITLLCVNDSKWFHHYWQRPKCEFIDKSFLQKTERCCYHKIHGVIYVFLFSSEPARSIDLNICSMGKCSWEPLQCEQCYDNGLSETRHQKKALEQSTSLCCTQGPCCKGKTPLTEKMLPKYTNQTITNICGLYSQ